MILHSLKFHNFGLFYGTQEIQFAHKRTNNNQQNTTLILASNGGGKSTFMRGLNYLFWGEYVDSDDNTLDLEQAISDKAIKEIGDSKTIPVWIECKFEIAGKIHTLKRGFDGSQSKDKRHVTNKYLHRIDHESTEDPKTTNAHYNQDFITKNLPKELYKFYFIREEGLSSNLGSDEGSLAESLSDVFKKAELEKLKRDLRLSKEKVDKEIVENAAGYKRWSNLNNEKNYLEKQIDEIQKGKILPDLSNDPNDSESICFISDKITGIKTEINQLTIELENMTAEIDPSLADNMNALRNEIEELEKNREDLLQRYPKKVGSEGWLFLLKKEFETVYQDLQKEYNNNNLPSTEFSEAVIKQILESDNQTCICNRVLTERAIDALKNQLERIKESTTATEKDYIHEEELYKLMDKLNPDKKTSKQNYFYQAQLFSQQVPTFRKKIDKDSAEILREEDNYNQMQLRYSNQDDTLYKEKKQKKEDLEEDLESYNRDIGRRTSDLQNARNQLHTINRQLRGEKTPPNVDKKIAQSELIQNLIEYTKKFETQLITLVHKVLEKETRKMHAKLYRSDNKPSINNKTFLPEILKNGQRRALGGAEGQCLALSFMMALNEARSTMNKYLKELKVNILDSNEHAVVLDSILGKVEKDHQKPVVKNIPLYTPQTILLFADQQWADGKVIGKVIESSIGKKYYFDCETSDSKYKDSSKVMKCYGKKIKVLDYKKNSTSNSKIREIK